MTSRWILEVEKLRADRGALARDEPGRPQRGQATLPGGVPRGARGGAGARSACASPPSRSTATEVARPLYTELGTRFHHEGSGATARRSRPRWTAAGLDRGAGRRRRLRRVRRGRCAPPTRTASTGSARRSAPRSSRSDGRRRSSARSSRRSRAARPPAKLWDGVLAGRRHRRLLRAQAHPHPGPDLRLTPHRHRVPREVTYGLAIARDLQCGLRGTGYVDGLAVAAGLSDRSAGRGSAELLR